MEVTMKNIILTFLLIALSPLATNALAQQKSVDAGKQEFDVTCATCHGVDAKGDGIVGAALKVKPPDLTLLSKNNGGVFPLDRIIKVIDGRDQVTAHGSRDMPIWGTRYSVLAAEHYFDVPYDQEKYVRARILALTDYLNRIQQK
jgi:mono/diheme cytochrome c family protein